MVAKATPTWFAGHLEWEVTTYKRLRSVQGTHVPVCLGGIDMEKPYRYEGIAELWHMMFLSYGGKRLDNLLGKLTSTDQLLIAEQLDRSVKAIHNL